MDQGQLIALALAGDDGATRSLADVFNKQTALAAREIYDCRHRKRLRAKLEQHTNSTAINMLVGDCRKRRKR